MKPAQKKAVALISGGLDSMLAVKCMQEQSIYVEGITFKTGFSIETHTKVVKITEEEKTAKNNAQWVADKLGIKLHFIDVVEQYKDVVTNPQYGYGANLNPCLDCKIFMIQQAAKWMQKNNFDFIITGEIIGQRPMSQRKDTLPKIAKLSGIEELIVRPLCAKNLKPTLPEKEGWINRDKLFAFSGRSRKPQIELANQYSFKDFVQPSGGCCFLTNQAYSARLYDLWQARGTKHYELEDILLLKIGRHIRPAKNYKLIVGRNEEENNYLEKYAKQFISLKTINIAGPFVVIDGKPDEKDIHLAAKIVARYSKIEGKNEVTIKIDFIDGKSDTIKVKPLKPEEVLPSWFIDKKILKNYPINIEVMRDEK